MGAGTPPPLAIDIPENRSNDVPGFATAAVAGVGASGLGASTLELEGATMTGAVLVLGTPAISNAPKPETAWPPFGVPNAPNPPGVVPPLTTVLGAAVALPNAPKPIIIIDDASTAVLLVLA